MDSGLVGSNSFSPPQAIRAATQKTAMTIFFSISINIHYFYAVNTFFHAKKQLFSPVWQAASLPWGKTLNKRQSKSQSGDQLTIFKIFPLVVPLCQSSPLLLLQNTISPFFKLRLKASSFIQAIISTVPSSACWTIAGIIGTPSRRIAPLWNKRLFLCCAAFICFLLLL